MSFVIHTLREREREYLLNDSNMALYYRLLKILKLETLMENMISFSLTVGKVNISISHCCITNKQKHSAA